MNSDRPPRSERPERTSEDDQTGRKILERIMPEVIKRVVERGVEKLVEGPENIRHFVDELKLPKEIASYLLVQIDETKNGLYRVVAKEIRDFLENTDVSDAITKALTKLSFEIKTEIRFIPNGAAASTSPDGRLPKPEVRSSVSVRTGDRRSERPPRPPRGGDEE